MKVNKVSFITYKDYTSKDNRFVIDKGEVFTQIDQEEEKDFSLHDRIPFRSIADKNITISISLERYIELIEQKYIISLNQKR